MSSEQDSGCLSCRFYRAMNANPLDGGVCRRHAPTLEEGPSWYRGWPRRLPPVEPGDFCGEWEPAQPTEAPPARRRGRKPKSPRAPRSDDSDALGLQRIIDAERQRLVMLRSRAA